MKKLKTTFALSLALAVTPSLGFAQSQLDVQRAKAQLWAAQDAFDGGDYSNALAKVEAAEEAMGSAGEPTLLLKVKSLYELQRYEDAKTTLEELYTYSPSERTQKEVAPILLEIDERIASKKEAEIFEQERIAASELQAARDRETALQRQAETKRRQADIEAIEEAKLQANMRQWEARFARPQFGNPIIGYKDFEIIPPATYQEADLKSFKKLAKKCYRKYKANEGKDIDSLPCIRNTPIFPAVFLQGDVSGYCTLNFDIDGKGHTKNVEIIYCTDNVLKNPTFSAVQNFYYMPANSNGMIVDRRNIYSRILFTVTDKDDIVLPYSQYNRSKLESFIIDLNVEHSK